MKAVKVVVSGHVNTGKTLVASLITQLLRFHGVEVTYIDMDAERVDASDMLTRITQGGTKITAEVQVITTPRTF